MLNLISSNNKPLIFLAFFMALFVTASNFLVQYPINFFGMEEFLTYGAFIYPVTFLITDLANRAYGKAVAKKVVYVGFVIGILLTLFVSTNFEDNESLVLRNYIIVGYLALILLIPMYLTSFKYFKDKIKEWKKLHKIIYLVYLFILAHIYLIIKADYYYLILFSSIFLVIIIFKRYNIYKLNE